MFFHYPSDVWIHPLPNRNAIGKDSHKRLIREEVKNTDDGILILILRDTQKDFY